MRRNITGYIDAVEQHQGDNSLKLMLNEADELDPQLPRCVCPICLSDKIKFEQLQENYTERAFFLYKCEDCGAEFILLEDKIDSCRRGIINCKERISYENKKIETFEKILKGNK